MLYKTALVGRVFSLLILVLFLLCSDVTGATEEGLIAHWPLDGDAKDASGNGHDLMDITIKIYTSVFLALYRVNSRSYLQQIRRV